MVKEQVEDLLYHGSRYEQTELMPGFKRSGFFVQWDRIENNHFLYATTEKDVAIGLGLSAAFEGVYGLDRYQFDGREIIIHTDNTIVDVKGVLELVVYLYTIPHRDGDGWQKNFNPHNNITTEYKTTRTIKPNLPVEKVNIKKWLADKKVTLVRKQLATESVHVPIYLRPW